jgi:pimeloyl-ACP methyl ester carboxylesterase
MWMPGIEMGYLRRRLARYHGFEGQLFSYPSVQGTLDENAGLLADFLKKSSYNKRLHLVGHSLGGVLLLRMLALDPHLPVDRAVCIGSPLCGSRAAIDLGRHDWGKSILGKTVAQGVTGEPASVWAGPATARHEIGIIAGTRAAGLGRLVTKFGEPSDGTVAVSETQLAGAKDHICIASSHSGLVLSKSVALQVAAFLQNGVFHRA